MKFWHRLKEKWNVKTDGRMAVIFLVFALTGSSIVFVRAPIFELLGVTSDTSLLIRIPLYIAVVVPTYQILLIIYGTIFGEFRFFWEFEKKMLRRFRLMKAEKPSAD